jgi:hypothetical protein
VLAEAAAITSKKSLLPPTKAGFVDGFAGLLTQAALVRERAPMPTGVPQTPQSDSDGEPVVPDLDSIRQLAERLLTAYLVDDCDSPDRPRPEVQEEHGIALRYVEALMRQEEVIQALAEVDPGNSPLHASLAGRDRERINEFLLYRSIMGRFHTLDTLVDEWKRLVNALEDHPDAVLREEYEDWLTARDALANALSMLPPPKRWEAESQVRRLDSRFLALSRPVATPIRPASGWRVQAWWWFRVPRVATTPDSSR